MMKCPNFVKIKLPPNFGAKMHGASKDKPHISIAEK